MIDGSLIPAMSRPSSGFGPMSWSVEFHEKLVGRFVPLAWVLVVVAVVVVGVVVVGVAVSVVTEVVVSASGTHCEYCSVAYFSVLVAPYVEQQSHTGH
jgi:hypothetical protein